MLEKQNSSSLVLNDKQLHVEAMIVRRPPPMYFRDVEKNRLMIKKLPNEITLDSLSKYLEKASDCRLSGWILGNKHSTVMLEFEGEPNYIALRNYICSKPFKGQMISVEKVPLFTCLQVLNLSEKVSDEHVTIYFENKFNQKKITFERQSIKNAFIELFSHDVAKTVLAQEHKIGDLVLSLAPYDRSLKCVVPKKALRDPPSNWMPRTLTINCDQDHLRCIEKIAKIRITMERSLKEGNVIITWPGTGNLSVTLKQDKRDDQTRAKKWKEKCRELFTRCLDDIEKKTVGTSQEIWDNFVTMVSNTSMQSDLVVDFDDKTCEVHFIGLRTDVVTYDRKLNVFIRELEEKLALEAEEKSKVSETMSSLRPFQVALLETSKGIKKVRLIADVQQTLTGEFILKGKSQDLTEAKIIIHETLSQIVSKFLHLSDTMTTLIMKDETRSFVKDHFNKNAINAVYEIKGKNSITVHATSDEEAVKACSFIEGEFEERKIELNASSKHTLQLSEWQKFKEQLQEEYMLLEIDVNSEIVIACRKSEAGRITERIREFFVNHDAVEEFVKFSFVQTDLILKSEKKALEIMEVKLKKSAANGKLTILHEPNVVSGFAVIGSSAIVNSVIRDLHDFANNYTETLHELCAPGVVNLIESPKGKEQLSSAQQKHAVVLKVLNNDSSVSERVARGVKLKMEIAKGHDIILVANDILDINTDAIIISTDQELNLRRPLASEIILCGGEDIRLECQDFVRKNGALQVGQVFVSMARKLLCKSIIHAVRCTTVDEKAISSLVESIQSALKEACKRNYDSVAFPLNFGIPFKHQIVFIAIREFFLKNKTKYLKEINFVEMSNNEAIETFKEQMKTYESGLPRSATGVASSITTPEGLTVILHKGSICSLRIDVIVNSTAKTLMLGYGALSKTILDTAGVEIQQECTKKAPNGLAQHGDILATKGYKLPCQAVYHGSAIEWDDAGGQSEKVLRAFVSNALMKADSEFRTSLALPAIGTGKLQIPHDVTVKVIFEEIFKLSRTCPNTSLKTIYTVAFEENKASIAAFEKKFQEMQSNPLAPASLVNRTAPKRKISAYKEKVTVSISSLSQNVMKIVLEELEKFVKESSDEKIILFADQLTDEQVDRIDFLKSLHSVRIKLNDGGGLTVNGMTTDVALAAEQIKFILNDRFK